MSDLSPLERLKATYAARQNANTCEVDIFADGSLVAEVGSVDEAGAKGALLTVVRLQGDDAGDLTNDDLAQVIASATRGLYARRDDGTLEPLTDDGAQVSFGSLGGVLGYPQVTDPKDGVLIAFTEGDPPTINSFRLLLVAMTVAGFLAEGAVPGS